MVQEETKDLFNPFLKPYIKYKTLAWGGGTLKVKQS